MKNIKLSVRLEESNIETLKIEIENKGRSKLEKKHKPDFIDIVFKKKKKKVCTSNISTHSVGGRNTETYLEENMAK